jgi:CheB methylesterase
MTPRPKPARGPVDWTEIRRRMDAVGREVTRYQGGISSERAAALLGSDGVEGLKAVKAAGGRVLAQDEASSVVFGMPGEAMAAGVTDLVTGLDDLVQCLVQLSLGGSHADAHPHR